MLKDAALHTGIEPLDQFLQEVNSTVYAGKSEWWMVEETRDSLARLLQEPDWLPEIYCQPQPDCSYSQYPLYVDPDGAFCVTAVAFGPSIVTPIHNHTVWGVIGVYRGQECERRYRRLTHLDGSGESYLIETGCDYYKPGMVSGFIAPEQDIHSVATPLSGSVSIHIYGADISKLPRLNFDRVTGRASVVYSSFVWL
jgi:predicted metal-dependent enzyme (double-stranded beta helix superfamily)